MQPLLWFRYIDDIFFVWNHSEDELNKFFENLNNFKSNLKFTYEISKDNINLLVLNVSIKESHLVTYLYFKEMDRHQYLHYHSSHLEHIKKSIVYSQALRFKRNCTFEKDFYRHLVNIKSGFLLVAIQKK